MAGKPSHVATYHLGESRSMGRERWGRACEGFHQLNQFLDGEWLPDERNPCQSNVGRFELVRLSRRHEAEGMSGQFRRTSTKPACSRSRAVMVRTASSSSTTRTVLEREPSRSAAMCATDGDREKMSWGAGRWQ